MGHLFSVIWGESITFWGFMEQGTGGSGKTFYGAGEKGHFSFRKQGAKTPSP